MGVNILLLGVKERGEEAGSLMGIINSAWGLVQIESEQQKRTFGHPVAKNTASMAFVLCATGGVMTMSVTSP